MASVESRNSLPAKALRAVAVSTATSARKAGRKRKAPARPATKAAATARSAQSKPSKPRAGPKPSERSKDDGRAAIRAKPSRSAMRSGKGVADLSGRSSPVHFTEDDVAAAERRDEDGSGTRLAVVTMAFGLGTARGPLAAGFLVKYGVAVPFAVGAALGVCALVLVYTQVFATIDKEYRIEENRTFSLAESLTLR